MSDEITTAPRPTSIATTDFLVGYTPGSPNELNQYSPASIIVGMGLAVLASPNTWGATAYQVFPQTSVNSGDQPEYNVTTGVSPGTITSINRALGGQIITNISNFGAILPSNVPTTPHPDSLHIASNGSFPAIYMDSWGSLRGIINFRGGGGTYSAPTQTPYNQEVGRVSGRAWFTATGTVTFSSSTYGALQVNWTAHGLGQGASITFTNSGGALPTGLSSGVTYYVGSPAANSFFLASALTIANPGGSFPNNTILYTDSGSGTTTASAADWTGSCASICFVTSQTATNAAQGMYILFRTVANGALGGGSLTLPPSVAAIMPSGGLNLFGSLNENGPDDPGLGSILVGANIYASALPSGTLISPPAGLQIGQFWLDTTDSSQYPIVRVRAS